MTIPWKHPVVMAAAVALVAPLGVGAVAHAADATNLAVDKPIEASSVTQTYIAGNANDGNASSYWEGAGGEYPAHLTVDLGAETDLERVVVSLPPPAQWSARTQTFSVLGRSDGEESFRTLAASAAHDFDPERGNQVEVPLDGAADEVRLAFSANTGGGSGQVAELEVYGAPVPNPNLTVTEVTAAPASPTATTPVTLTATVENTGDLASSGTSLDARIGGSTAGSAEVGALEPGASAEVEVEAGTQQAGEHAVGAVVDPENTVAEQDESDNSFTAAEKLVVGEAPGPDLEVALVTSNPANPAVGADVAFTVQVRNRGDEPVPAGSVTRVVAGSSTLNGTTPAVPAGETVTVSPDGSWTATNGGATVTATADATDVVDETNEDNNTGTLAVTVGRGAAVPYTTYEAEDGRYTGTLLETDPLRTFGHTNFATESSGRESVRLTSTGQNVELTSTNETNSIVVRSSVPDAAGGGGQEKTISLYADGEFVQKLTLSSKHSWLYGTTDEPEGLVNTPGGDARRLFDESHALLERSYPAGTEFKLQRDADDDAEFYVIDLVELEQVAPPASKPARCTSITEYGAIPNDGLEDTEAIQAAVTADQEGEIDCVWIPEGQWRQEKKILTDDPLDRGTHNQVGISDVTIRGAGMWHSQLYSLIKPHLAPGVINHPHEGNFGFDIDDNVQISDIAIFGSGDIRGNNGQEEGGVGLNGRFGQDTKIENVWIEHANVGVWVGRDYSNIPELWGPGDGVEFTGVRIRNTYADGINFSNGTRNSTVFNSTFRNTGDDALAVWANPYVKDTAVDIGHDNAFRNNTVQLPWRANGIAIYGGYDNSIENNLISDTMNYPGIMLATDHSPLPFSGTTLIANNGLYRTGGAFWNEDQEFGAITIFPQTHDIVGVTIRDTDIYDSTYDGIQFKNGGGNMPDVRITDVTIDGSNNGSGILAMGGARGNAVLSNVTVTDSGEGDIEKEPGSQFVFTGE